MHQLLETLEDRLLMSAAPTVFPQMVGGFQLPIPVSSIVQATIAQYTTSRQTPATPTTSPTSAVQFTDRSMGSYNQLLIAGTSGNDSIVVSQSGSTLTVLANGITRTFTIDFAEIMIHGGDGNDSITVNSSVSLQTLLYGGAGTNTIVALGSGYNTIVTIGGGHDTVQGNGLNTSYWTDSTDSISYSHAEAAAGNVHVISSFYQPFGASSPVSLQLNGQAIKDPTDSGNTYTYSNHSLWGLGPVIGDVNQGALADCYFLAVLQSLAYNQTTQLRQMAVDLGDGTYAVQFVKNGLTTTVRVSGDLSAYYGNILSYNRLGATGDLWASIFEKAYAYVRTDANTYASLNWGWSQTVFSDLGLRSITTFTSGSWAPSAYSIWATMSATLANGKAYTVGSNNTVSGGAPIITGHCYSVIGTSSDASGNLFVTLRNPWGVDGVANSSNPNDGIITLSMALFQANFSFGCQQY